MDKRITLKNLKVCAFASEETTCFQATVLFDGKVVGEAKNDGHGGSTYVYANPQNRAALEMAEAYAKSLPAVVCKDIPNADGSPFTYAQTLDNLVDAIVADMDFQKRVAAALKRDLKKKVLFLKDGKLWTCTLRSTPAEVAIPQVAKRNPGCTILNTLSFDAALALYVEAQS